MKIRAFFTCALLFLATATLKSQGWLKWFPYNLYVNFNNPSYDDHSDIFQAEDGNFFMHFYTLQQIGGVDEKIIKLSPSGIILNESNVLQQYHWALPFKHMVKGENGEVAVFANSIDYDSLYIWRFDADLNLVGINGVPFQAFQKVYPQDNGSFLLFAVNTIYTTGINEFNIWHINDEGLELSPPVSSINYYYNPYGYIDDPKLIPAEDGSYYALYINNSPSTFNNDLIEVHKFDHAGNHNWVNFYQKEGFSSDRPYHFGAAVVGNSLYVNAFAKLIKFDAAGNKAWIKDNNTYFPFFYVEKMVPTNDGNLLMLSGGQGIQNILLKVDTNGVPLFAKNIKVEITPTYIVPIGNLFSFKPLEDGGTMFIGGSPTIAYPVAGRFDDEGSNYLNVVKGRMAIDSIDNCEVENSESGISNAKIRVVFDDSEYYINTGDDGAYKISTLSGQVELEPKIQELYLAPCDSTLTATLAPGTTIDTAILNIPVKVLGNCPIMNVEIVAPFYRRCFDNNATIHYCNLGNEVAENAEMTLYFSQGFSLVSAGLPITSQDGQTVTFSLGNLQPGDCGVIPITFHIGCEVALGQTWCITAIAEPSDVCFTLPAPFQNDPPHFERDCKPVIGSFDPNDKQAQPIGIGGQHFITNDTILTYLIRFQNTGTDTAFQVVVVDTLSPLLNPLTVFPGASSHPYRMQLGNGGVARFIFDNIMLPDSNVNEAASHGYVQFKIAQRRNIAAGLRIENSAAIYFDYNEPVITNTVFHTTWDAFETYDIAISENKCGSMVLDGQFPDASYLWSNGDTTPIITIYEPGWVHLTLTMPFGYVHHDSIYAAVQENDLQVSATLNHPRCYGSPDAGIDLQVASDPTHALIFNWNTGSNSEDLYFAVGGLYTVTVTSSNGCTKVEAYELVNPPPILVEVLQATNVSCLGGNDGQIQLVGTGGTGNFTWQWSNGATTPNPSNLTAGPHTWFAIDANSCFATGTVELGVEPLPFFSTVLEDISCHGYNDGFMEVVMGEGEGSYSIIWSTGTTGDSIVNLPPGTYGYELMYGNGCVFASFGYEIVEPFPITITMEGIAPTTGQANGSINTNAIGGKPPYEYLWSTGATTNPVTNLSAGSYAVTVTDKNGCTEVGTYQLESTSATGNPIALSNVLVSPNPSTNEFHLEFWLESPELFSIEAFNALGQHKQTVFPLEIHDSGKHSIKIQAFDWPSGPYLLLFSSPAGESQMKLVLKN